MAIFRKVALERLSSPEQLDQLMQVTSPRRWLALAAFVALILLAIFWGFVGSIPAEARGQGILIRQGGVSDVVSAVQGQVESVLVEVGEVVRKGQVIAHIRQEELSREIADAEARLRLEQDELQILQRYTTEQKRLKAQNRIQQKANLERTLRAQSQDRKILEERIVEEERLLSDGLITKQTLLASQQELNTIDDQIATQKLELDQLILDRLELEQELNEQLENQSREVQGLERESADLQAKLAENANVISPFDGRLLELMVKRGDVINPGSPMLSMEVIAEELLAVLFVPPADGKQVQVGMEVRVSPTTLKREEYGYMLGEVTWVAEFPSTSRGIMGLLANQELVTKLMAESPPIRVDVKLKEDPKTPTGYAWSSSRGPDLPISSGTLAFGSVIIRSDRPIDLVIPKMRSQINL